MPHVELPTGRIHYDEAGPSDGRPMVFVHGVLAAGDLWGPLLSPLADRGLRCIAPTWPMGAHKEAMREGTDLSPSGMARIIASFLEALDLEDVVVVGNDSGGAISQVLAVEHPERIGALVLTNCDTLEHFPPKVFKGLPVLARVPGALRAALTAYRFGPLRRSPLGLGLLSHAGFDDVAGPWIAQLFRDPAVFEDCRRFVAGANSRATLDAAERLRTFGKPIVLVWGADDLIFPVKQAREFLAVVGSGRLEVVPGARTFPMFDRADRVAELIAEAAVATTAAEPAAV